MEAKIQPEHIMQVRRRSYLEVHGEPWAAPGDYVHLNLDDNKQRAMFRPQMARVRSVPVEDKVRGLKLAQMAENLRHQTGYVNPPREWKLEPEAGGEKKPKSPERVERETLNDEVLKGTSIADAKTAAKKAAEEFERRQAAKSGGKASKATKDEGVESTI